MSLYIRDPDVAAWPRSCRILQAAGPRPKPCALRFNRQLSAANAKRSFAQRNAHVLEMADALGSTNPEFDSKAFFDRMWGDA